MAWKPVSIRIDDISWSSKKGYFVVSHSATFTQVPVDPGTFQIESSGTVRHLDGSDVGTIDPKGDPVQQADPNGKPPPGTWVPLLSMTLKWDNGRHTGDHNVQIDSALLDPQGHPTGAKASMTKKLTI